MRRPMIVVLAVFAACAISALAASGASAYVWQVNESNVSSPTEATGTTTLALTYHKAGNSESFSCVVDTKRTLKTEGRGEFTSALSTGGAKAIPCSITQYNETLCKSEVTIEAEQLPWPTELTTAGGALQDVTTAGGAHWKLKCKKVEPYTDYCGGATTATPYDTSAGIEELTTSTERASCLFGELQTTGAEPLKASGGPVGITPRPAPAWDLNGKVLAESVPVKWEGNLSISKASPQPTVECKASAEGTVGPAGAGQISSWTFSGCTGTDEGQPCESGTRTFIEARYLPWTTGLAVEGGMYDRMTGGEFKVQCRLKLGFNESFLCSAPFRAVAAGEAEGVVATWPGKEEEFGKCGKATISGKQNVVPTRGGTLDTN